MSEPYKEPEEVTVQQIMQTSEYRWITHGANKLAEALINMSENEMDEIIKYKDNFKVFLNYLLHDKASMSAFIYNLYSDILVKYDTESKKKRKPIKSYRIIPFSSIKEPNPYEFVSEEEQKYRKTCLILLDVIDTASRTIGLLTGRNYEDIRRELLKGIEVKTEND